VSGHDRDDVLADWMQRLAVPARQTLAPESDESTAVRAVPERLLISVARAAMACEFEVLLNQFQYPSATDVAVAALDLIQQLENKLSVYKPHSDFSLINRFAAERAINVSPDALAVIQLACDIHQFTDGAFDITAGTLSDLWGFSRRQGQLPTEAQIAEALGQVGSQYLRIDTGSQAIQMERSGVKVNPGGIGKGYALDRAANQLHSAGVLDFMLHGGLSSVLACGERQHPDTGGGWLVSLRHPWRLEEHLGTLRLRDQALATSGSGKQFFHFGGKRYSHIIDPRTGWPAQGMMSATVICPSAAVADALATALFVMGPESSRAFCEKHTEIAAVVMFADQRTGRPCLETYNTPPGMWLPGPSVASEK
jgi:thiamine biosynthesis lipoprotein